MASFFRVHSYNQEHEHPSHYFSNIPNDYSRYTTVQVVKILSVRFLDNLVVYTLFLVSHAGCQSQLHIVPWANKSTHRPISRIKMDLSICLEATKSPTDASNRRWSTVVAV